MSDARRLSPSGRTGLVMLAVFVVVGVIGPWIAPDDPSKIDLAHRFGSVAVAEGIENVADLQALQVMRCDFGEIFPMAEPASTIVSGLTILLSVGVSPPPHTAPARWQPSAQPLTSACMRTVRRSTRNPRKWVAGLPSHRCWTLLATSSA